MTETTITEIAPRLTVYDAAVDLVKREQKCGIGFLQSHLGIGRTLVDQCLVRMESEGIVSKVRTNGSREVLK